MSLSKAKAHCFGAAGLCRWFSSGVAKNILYTVVNSRAYEAENLNPGMASWKIVMIGADIVVALLVVGLEYTAIKGYKKRKEEEAEDG